jgi:tetratricopeptide repeat protein/FG-GAP repeat protein
MSLDVRRRTVVFSLIAAAATAALLFAPARAAQPPAATVQAATARLQAGDPAGAITILEQVVQQQPADARGWRMLGTARQRTKDFDGALTAYQRALALDPSFPTPLYNIGAVYALEQDADAAFDWLRKAKESRRIDMTQIEVDADVAGLRTDPRFKSLLPTSKDFAHPFTETVKIVREWDGEAGNDQFGWIARNAGDLDGDGIADVVTSAPTKRVDGENAGRVYAYSTKTGRLLWSVDGHTGDRLGLGVESAGDTDGDGVPDVIASAPGNGTAFIYSGKNGHVLHTFTAENKADGFGRHVAGVGDVNRDGFADVIVGAPGNSAGGAGAGRAYVYSGRDGALLLRLTGERAGDGFGSAVAGFADRSRLFLIVGAPAAGARKTGRTYVYESLGEHPAFVIESDETGGALGAMFLSAVGDVDGDRVPDIYASDWANNAKGPATGRIYVHSGKTGARLMTLTGETAGDGFGIGPATAGDVDGDGFDDLIIGAWQYARDAIAGGRAYLFSGRDRTLMKTFTCRIPGDTFGFDAVGMGDVDRDGTVDFLITSAWSGIHGFHSGRMFIVSSGVRRRLH